MAPVCEPLCSFGDRLYFTTFPHPPPSQHALNHSCQNNDAPPIRLRSKIGPSTTPVDDAAYYYFSIDDSLVYLSFFEDWGPLNLAMVYKACILIHSLLEDKELQSHNLVLYSSNDPRKKANAALLMALFVMIVKRHAPWEAFQPIAELEIMPFRDAGRGQSDFHLSIQDCLWGVWKAIQYGLCDMNSFSVDDYEFYEKVENGDWNWITPSFIAFASPVESAWMKAVKEGGTTCASPVRRGAAPTTPITALQRKLPTPFLNCLEYFERRNVKLVVRLNNMLYDKNHFTDRSIEHLELYFDDGTNPTDEIVRKFIDVVDPIVESGNAIAVHCKAGLGRTGTLIGAYLIWKYGFTAHEAIAFMRIVRPGSVVGPQQQYMYIKQGEWMKWAALDELRAKEAAKPLSPSQPTALVTPATPPAEEDDEDTVAMELTRAITPPILATTIPIPSPLRPVTPNRQVSIAAARARAISPPGQPRKTPSAKRTVADVEQSEEEDELEALPVLGNNNTKARLTRSKVKATTGKPAPRVVPASDQRPTRATRSMTQSGTFKKPGVGLASIGVKPNGPGPNKIPRLANGLPPRSGTSLATRPRPVPPSPTPSRLPTLARRAQPTTSIAQVASNSILKRVPTESTDTWMANNAVVVPGSKSERPGLRNVRRRRSSFSAADVVA